MNVLFLSPYPPASDGIGNYTWVLASAVRDAGATVGVVVPWPGSDAPAEVIGSLATGGKDYDRLRSLVIRWDPDVIHIQFAIAAFGTRTIALIRFIGALRRDLQVPVVVTVHEFTRESTLLPIVGRIVYRWIAGHCDQVIVHTDVALDAAITRFGIPADKVAVIPHPIGPVPTATSSCDELRSRFGLIDARVLLAFGFIHVDKGLDDFVQAMRILSQTDRAALEKVVLVVAGAVRPRRGVFRAFELRDRLHLLRVLRLAKRSGLADHVRLTGYVPAGEVASWFALAEAVVLPYRRIEESGVASLARSVDAPVLASTAGGLAKQFAGSKWTFPPGSPRDLAQPLGLFLRASPAEREVPPVIGRLDDLASVVTRTLGIYRAVKSESEQDLHASEQHRQPVTMPPDHARPAADAMHQPSERPKEMRRLKVAIVAPYFYPRVGGAEVYTLNIARKLRALGWTVFVVTSGRSRDPARECFEGMTIYRLKTTATLSNTPVGIAWRRQLRRIFREEQPDVINAHTPVPYLADIAERASGRIPFVLTYHNDLDKDFIIAKLLVRLAHLALIRRTLIRSTAIIATSQYYLDESPYLEAVQSKVRIVPPGVDFAKFHPGVKISSQLTSEFEGNKVVLFVGSLSMSHRHKGLSLLIKAFAAISDELPEARLVIVGDGSGRQMYMAQASSAGVTERVRFAGHVSDQELAQFYAVANVLAMPSTNRSEGFGMVFIEASAAGTPVVGSRVGGVPYAIKDNETGLLIEPRSVDSLQYALRRILNDDELATRLGNAGSERVRREFDWTALARCTSEILAAAAESATA